MHEAIDHGHDVVGKISLASARTATPGHHDHRNRLLFLPTSCARIGAPPETGNTFSGGRGGFVGDAEPEVFDVVDGLVEEHRDVVIVERVDDAASVADSGDQPHRAQKA